MDNNIIIVIEVEYEIYAMTDDNIMNKLSVYRYLLKYDKAETRKDP